MTSYLKQLTKPLVSIIVPIYNTILYLDRCIDSTLKQTYSNVEILLVDDGSLDECAELCDNYVKNHSNILTIHKDNGGLSNARLIGFRAAYGEYILFVDSDDYIHPQMVEKLVEAIQNYDADLALSSYETVNGKCVLPYYLPYNDKCIDDHKRIESDYILPLIGRKKYEVNIPGFIWIRLLKRKLIKESFFVPERIYFMEDHVFDILYAEGVKKIAIVNEPLYSYCFNANSLSNRYRENKWEMLCNLHGFYVEYLQWLDLPDKYKRLDCFLVSAFCTCLDNAVLTGSYRSYREELDLILRSNLMPSVWRAAKNIELISSAQVSLFFCRIHAYMMLYYIRKVRLKRSSLLS